MAGPYSAIHRSCLGAPRQTNTTSACAAFTASATGAASWKYPSWVPQTIRFGWVCFKFSAACSATPGLAPSRYSRRPVSAMRATSPVAKSMPGTRPCKGVPKILAAWTTPMPSGRTRPAPFRMAPYAGSWRAMFTISGFGVTT